MNGGRIGSLNVLSVGLFDGGFVSNSPVHISTVVVAVPANKTIATTRQNIKNPLLPFSVGSMIARASPRVFSFDKVK
jgi:hypothetical protein